jgi:uncharacterized protein (UPF0276 family)
MMPAIGYGVREENRTILDDPAINAAEITYEQADDPLRIDRYLGDDRDFDVVSVHALELSLACPEPPLRKYLEGIKAVAEENGAQSVSDHLGFTRDGDGRVSMGHFQAPPFTPVALDVTSRNVERCMAFYKGYDFYVENIAYLFLFKGQMSEAEFIIKLIERTGCGLLLDVTNVYANSVNHGYDGYEFIRGVMPFAPRVQMHLAGGYFDEKAKRYFDSHSFPVHQEVWDLYRFALAQGKGKIDAVFIERDADFPSEAGWRSEVREARAIAEQVAGIVPAEVRS